MKNYEKYKDAIIDFLNNASCRDCTRNCDDCNTCILSILEEKLGVYTRYELEQHLNEEYKEPIQLSNDEYVILKNLPKEWEWIVRDIVNLILFKGGKPNKENEFWIANNGTWSYFKYAHLFKFIKNEDEPYEIAKLIANYEKEHQDE